MTWNSYPESNPANSGPYLASLKKVYGGGELIFQYVLHYDCNLDKWFRYDPFAKDEPIKDEFPRDSVLGWASDITTFIG